MRSLFKLKTLFAALLILWTFVLSPAVWAQRIVLISDLNGRYGSTRYHSRVTSAVESIKLLKPELVIIVGDMVAGQRLPLLSRDQVDAMWSAFNIVVTDPLRAAGIDLIVTPGNHDGSAQPKFALERDRFKVQWDNYPPRFPLLEGSDWPRRYALLAGNILVISIDGSNTGRVDSRDLNLLKTVLETKANTVEYVIVVSHLPIWPFAQGREKEIITDSALKNLLSEHEVNFFISGHHHVFYPGVDDDGTVHLGNGPLGGNSRKVVGSERKEPFSFVVLDLKTDCFEVTARKAPEFTEDIHFPELPSNITGGQGNIKRLDLSNLLHQSCSAKEGHVK